MTVYTWEVEPNEKKREAMYQVYLISKQIGTLEAARDWYCETDEQKANLQERIDRLQIDLDSWKNFVKNWKG